MRTQTKQTMMKQLLKRFKANHSGLLRKGLLPLLFLSFVQLHAQGYRYGNVPMGGTGYISGIVTSKKQQNLVYCRTDVGGAYRWDAAASRWIPLLDWASANQSSYQGVASIALDPRVPQNVYMAVGNYGGTSAILRSTDFGATFAITNTTSQFKIYGNNIGRGNGEKLQVDPNNSNILFYGSNYNGLFKSTDAGVTWTNVSSFPIATTSNTNGISFILFDSASGTAGNATPKIYVGVSSISNPANLYVTTDGGATFNPVPTTGGPVATTSLPQRAALASDGNLYITYDNACGPGQETSGFVWKYNPSTTTWTNVSPATAIGFGGVSIDPQNPQRMIVSTANAFKAQYVSNGNIVYGDRYYLSNNGGATWTTLVPVSGYSNNNITLNPNGIPWITGQSLHWGGCIEFDPFNSNKAWVTSGNGIYTCNDLNSLTRDNVINTWNFASQGIEEAVPYDMISIPGGPIFTGIADYDGFKISDISQYPASKYSPSSAKTTSLAYAIQNPSYVVRVGSIMAYSTNQGATWTQTATSKGTYGRLAVSADGSIIVHCPSGSTTTWWSNDNGATWTASTGLAVTSAIPWADPVNANIFYVYAGGAAGTMYISTDYGATFTSTGGSPGASGSAIIRTVLGKSGHLWVAMSGGGLKFSADSGKTFSAIAGPTFCQAVGVGKAAPNATYNSVYIWGTVGGVNGLFGSFDKGLTWIRLNDDAHQYGGIGNGNFVYGDNNVAGRYYYGTLGRGIVYGEPVIPLPVALASFTGFLKNGNEIQLNWTTATEAASSHFEIEKSSDGAGFRQSGKVQSAAPRGNSWQPLQYSFVDNTSSSSGTIYYRLKRVGKDGRFVYSNVIKIRIGALDKTTTVSIFPNPSLPGRFSLQVTIRNALEVTTRVVDMTGRVVYTGPFVKLVGGDNTVALDEMKPLAAGVYLLEIITTDGNEIIGRNKMVVQ